MVRYLKGKVGTVESHTFNQTHRGRPGPNTAYLKKTKKSWHLTWETDQAAMDYDRKSDGRYPLLTNDRTLTNAQVLEAHKGQPEIEKRFEQTKTVLEIAPVLFKNQDRIEALFLLYFLALTVQALIERELRLAMKREGIPTLPLYPEERVAAHPTTDQVFRLFSLVQRQTWTCDGRDGRPVKTFFDELSPRQQKVLGLLGVPERAYLQFN